MAIANCARCNQIFNKLYGRKVCSDCVQAEEEAFRMIVDYLDDHPGSNAGQIAVGTDLDEAQILCFIREGRLTLLEKLGDQADVECRRCGGAITSGQYCQACYREVQDSLRNSASNLEQQRTREAIHLRHAETMEEKRRGDLSR